MSLTPTAMDETTNAIAALLGSGWRHVGSAERDGSTLLADDAIPDRTVHIDLRPVFSGRVIALHLACTGIAYDVTHSRWTEGFHTWNTGVHLADDTDPADQIAEAIRDRLLPAAVRKPRHVGDRPWEDEAVMTAEVHTPEPAAKKPRTRKPRKTTKTTA
ncbi:hypothetical protein [Streptomyces sp. NPDC057557]|uniref:hypothetical protein n=1 Tax=Streptomyces sp. NPDC057557 TaxID=3346167 RepID=UPI00369BA626